MTPLGKTITQKTITLPLIFCLACSCLAQAQTGTPPTLTLPNDSVYQTPLTLRDQNGNIFSLDALRGHPVIISMMYASCKTACPLNIETIKRIRAAAKQKSGHSAPPVVMISFNPKQDTVQKLAMMANMHHLTAPDWRFTRPEQGDVRAFAASLGISYRIRPNGEISHNVEIVLLDKAGRIIAKTEQLDTIDTSFVNQVANTN